MLQQTQVAVVLPYFHRWMERLPTIESLASVPVEEVIKLWEGLGYYSRARSLHRGARQVMEEFGGSLPSSAEKLSTIKGIGPYTVGAILSFAFHQKAPAVDGNVIRLLTRFFGIGEDVSKPKVVEGLREMTLDLLPDERPWEVMEGMIELGATVCKRKPDCGACPLSGECHAFKEGNPELYPYKSQKVATVHLERSVAVVEAEGHFLVGKGGAGKVMADLYEFPYLSLCQDPIEAFEAHLDLPLELQYLMPQVGHTFTRYRVRLHPVLFRARRGDVEGYEWAKDLQGLPFSSGHRRIVTQLSLKDFP